MVRTLNPGVSSSYIARSIYLIFSSSLSSNFTFFFGFPVFALIPGGVLTPETIVFPLETGFGSAGESEDLRRDFIASSKGFVYVIADDASKVVGVGAVVAVAVGVGVVGVVVFFRKLGSFALGFAEKKPESDCAPFGAPLVVPAVLENVPVVGELRLSFLTATRTPAGLTTAAFFVAGAVDALLVVPGVARVPLDGAVEASSFRFLGRSSGETHGSDHVSNRHIYEGPTVQWNRGNFGRVRTGFSFGVLLTRNSLLPTALDLCSHIFDG
jgi:hypothetical protein